LHIDQQPIAPHIDIQRYQKNEALEYQGKLVFGHNKQDDYFSGYVLGIAKQIDEPVTR
jgi:hypothetical protein